MEPSPGRMIPPQGPQCRNGTAGARSIRPHFLHEHNGALDGGGFDAQLDLSRLLADSARLAEALQAEVTGE